MVQRYITVRTSDLSGAELAEGDGDTIVFSVGRSSYTIDLTSDEVGGFYDALKPYTDVARVADNKANGTTPSRPAAPKRDLGAVRDWAKANGFDVNGRGRVPAVVLDAYDAAH